MAQKDLRRVRTAAANIKRSQQRLVQAIVAAHLSGESIRDIAPYAGLSVTRIHQIIREHQQDG